MESDPITTPLPIEAMLTDQRRPLSVSEHQEWRKRFYSSRPQDEIDELLEDIRAAEFEEKGARP